MLEYGEAQFSSSGDFICENCKFYIWVDSGYGYCRRYPPKKIRIGKWWQPRYRTTYQLVEWCRRACGEFQGKKTGKGGK